MNFITGYSLYCLGFLVIFLIQTRYADSIHYRKYLSVIVITLYGSVLFFKLFKYFSTL